MTGHRHKSAGLIRGERVSNGLTASLISHMAATARRQIARTGFCTDDDFKAAGFSAKAINAHGNRARHSAVQTMARERNRATGGDPAAGNSD